LLLIDEISTIVGGKSYSAILRDFLQGFGCRHIHEQKELTKGQTDSFIDILDFGEERTPSLQLMKRISFCT